MMYVLFFFKQKTAYEMRIIDWSSDECSSDLYPTTELVIRSVPQGARRLIDAHRMLVQSLKSRDKEMARLWTRRHLNDWRKGFELAGHAHDQAGIGSATGRERVCQYVESSVVAVSCKKKMSTRGLKKHK